jgi:hypothetical protein
MTRELTETWLESGAKELPARSIRRLQSAADIRRDLDARIATLGRLAADVYARWTRRLAR